MKCEYVRRGKYIFLGWLWWPEFSYVGYVQKSTGYGFKTPLFRSVLVSKEVPFHSFLSPQGFRTLTRQTVPMSPAFTLYNPAMAVGSSWWSSNGGGADNDAHNNGKHRYLILTLLLWFCVLLVFVLTLHKLRIFLGYRNNFCIPPQHWFGPTFLFKIIIFTYLAHPPNHDFLNNFTYTNKKLEFLSRLRRWYPLNVLPQDSWNIIGQTTVMLYCNHLANSPRPPL